jgi:uncharacterized lipoprotein YmbA
MRTLSGCVAPALCAIVLVGMTGCANSRDTRFYVLTALPAVETPGGTSPGRSPAVGLHPVGLPQYLDRPQIVTRAGENMLQLAEFDQWGSPLQDNVTRVLAANLSVLVPADRVAVFPWMKDSPIEYEVTVEVAQFEGTLGGSCSLVADWAISRRGGKESLAAGGSRHTEPAGNSYATLVAAHSRLVAALGRDIAAAFNAFRPSQAAEASAGDPRRSEARRWP